MSITDLATSGIESLTNTICGVESDDEDEKKELLKDLEKCLSYGVILCKAEPNLCHWFCGAMIKQVNRNTLSGKFSHDTYTNSLWKNTSDDNLI